MYCDIFGEKHYITQYRFNCFYQFQRKLTCISLMNKPGKIVANGYMHSENVQRAQKSFFLSFLFGRITTYTFV